LATQTFHDCFISITDLQHQPNKKQTNKLHRNVPVGGKGVDCETARKILLVISTVSIHYIEESHLFDCRFIIFVVAEC